MALFIASPYSFANRSFMKSEQLTKATPSPCDLCKSAIPSLIERRNAAAIDLNLLTFRQNWIAHQPHFTYPGSPQLTVETQFGSVNRYVGLCDSNHRIETLLRPMQGQAVCQTQPSSSQTLIHSNDET